MKELREKRKQVATVADRKLNPEVSPAYQLQTGTPPLNQRSHPNPKTSEKPNACLFIRTIV